MLNCWWLSSLLCAEHVCPGALDFFFATFGAFLSFEVLNVAMDTT